MDLEIHKDTMGSAASSSIFFFFFQIQFFPSCGKEPLLASVSLNDFSGSHMGFEQEAEHERLPLSKKQLVRIQQSSKDGVYEKLSD